MGLITYLLRNLLAEKIIWFGSLLNSGDGEEPVSICANTGWEISGLVRKLGMSWKPLVIYGWSSWVSAVLNASRFRPFSTSSVHPAPQAIFSLHQQLQEHTQTQRPSLRARVPVLFCWIFLEHTGPIARGLNLIAKKTRALGSQRLCSWQVCYIRGSLPFHEKWDSVKVSD